MLLAVSAFGKAQKPSQARASSEELDEADGRAHQCEYGSGEPGRIRNPCGPTRRNAVADRRWRPEGLQAVAPVVGDE